MKWRTVGRVPFSHAVYIVQRISANINDVNKINTVTVQVFQPWYTGPTSSTAVRPQ